MNERRPLGLRACSMRRVVGARREVELIVVSGGWGAGGVGGDTIYNEHIIEED